MMKFKFLVILLLMLVPLVALAQEVKYTVVPFRGDDKKLSFELAEMFMADLAKSGKIKLVDRLHFDNILDELSKMEMALVKKEDVIDFGASEGANKIISGNYTTAGDKIILNAWVSDVKTSEVLFSDNIEGNKKDIFYFVHQLANRLHYKITGGIWIPEDIAMTPSAQGPSNPDIPKFTPHSTTPTPAPEYVNPRPQETDPLTLLVPKSVNAERLWNNIVDLNIDRGEFSTYHQKESMIISFRASEDCYMTIYSIQADGSIRLVFPNKFDSNNYLSASRLYKIPSEDMWWEYMLSGTSGLESLVAIATIKPLNLDVGKEKLSTLDLMPTINTSPNDFIEKTIIPELQIDPDNKYVFKIVKYYLAD
ncbi:MAG: Protein TolB [bacterium ADurb.Bin363]|nr:MAG: Protein TolB [bacterium ADurb.Bin363]